MEKEQYVPLVQGVQRGDADAADALFGGIYQDVYYFILKTVKDSSLAEDLTQDALIEIFQKIGTLRDPVAFPAWCRQIAYFRCTAHFRKKKEVLVEEDEEGASLFDTIAEDKAEFIPEEALNKKDFRATVMNIIDSLSEEQRSAVLMYYFEEFPISRIAEIQGVSEGTVKSRLNYARKAIKGAVEDYEKKTGTRLHAIPFLPFLFQLFSADKAANPLPASTATAISASVSSATGLTLSSSLSAAAATTAAKAGIGLGGKIVIGALTAAVLAGGAFAGVKLLEEAGLFSDSGEVLSATEEEGEENKSQNFVIETFAEEEFEELSADDVVVEGWVKYTDFKTYEDGLGNLVRTVTAYPEKETPDESVTSIRILEKVKGYTVLVGEGFGKAYPGLLGLDLECSVIPERAFIDCKSLEIVNLHATVREIGERAFYGLENLEQIRLLTAPDCVIHYDAFWGTGFYNNEANWQGEFLVLDHVLLYAKGHVDKTEYVIPEGVTSLAKGSFGATGGIYLLERSYVTVPNSLVFGLETSDALNYLGVYLSEDHPVYRIADGFLYHKKTGELLAVYRPAGNFPIPDDGSVTVLGEESFKTLSDIIFTRDVVLPASLTTVKDRAFKDAKVSIAALPEGLSEIGEEAFANTGFATFSLPRSLKTVKAGAFNNCGIRGTVIIPNTLTALEKNSDGEFLPILMYNDVTLVLEEGNPLFEGLDEKDVIRQLLGK